MTKFDQADPRRTLLRWGILASLPSCAALVQLIILLTLNMVVSVWATTCMRVLYRSYNTGRTYGQVRLGKTTDNCLLAGGYNNFQRSSNDLFSDQPAITRLGKGPLWMFISTMAFRSEGHTKGTPHTGHLLALAGQ